MISLLVVDDDAVFRRRLVRAFQDRGCVAGEAACGAAAAEYVRREKPEAVVLDLKLEDESGISILQDLLRIDSELRVVILTGYGTIATTVEALKLGAVNYLTKPVDADVILAKLGDTSRFPTCTLAEVPRLRSGIGKRPLLPVPDLQQVEWDHIQRVMNDCEGNITHASKVLGLHRRSLQRKLVKRPGRLK